MSVTKFSEFVLEIIAKKTKFTIEHTARNELTINDLIVIICYCKPGISRVETAFDNTLELHLYRTRSKKKVWSLFKKAVYKKIDTTYSKLPQGKPILGNNIVDDNYPSFCFKGYNILK